MAKLETVSTADLEASLSELCGGLEPERVVAAIIYKRGPSVPMIADWLDVQEQTVYRWFDRLEDEPIEQAIQHRPRPGRPSKLGDAAHEEFLEALSESPEVAGYDRSAWTIDLASEYLEDEFGVQYSQRHVRRLLEDVDDVPSPEEHDPDS
jgi:transposase